MVLVEVVVMAAVVVVLMMANPVGLPATLVVGVAGVTSMVEIRALVMAVE